MGKTVLSRNVKLFTQWKNIRVLLGKSGRSICFPIRSLRLSQPVLLHLYQNTKHKNQGKNRSIDWKAGEQIWESEWVPLNSFYFTYKLAFVLREKWIIIMIASDKHWRLVHKSWFCYSLNSRLSLLWEGLRVAQQLPDVVRCSGWASPKQKEQVRQGWTKFLGRTKLQARNIKSLGSSEGQAYTRTIYIQETKSGFKEKQDWNGEMGRSRKESRITGSKSMEIFAHQLEHVLGVCYKSFQPSKYLWVEWS